MRVFVRRIITYVLVVAAIILAMNLYYKSHLYYGPEEAKFQVVPDSIDICNLGSSHGVHSYYYEGYGDELSCFNMALDSQYLSYDMRVLEYYQDRLHSSSVVIIDISYFAIWGKPETEDENFESRNKRYYKFLPVEHIKEYDRYTDIMVRYLPIISDNPKVVCDALFRPVSAEDIKSYYDVDKIIDKSEAQKSAEAACERHLGSDHRDKKGELIVNEEERQALYDIVDICREHGAIPVFVTVPYLKEYKETIENNYPDFMDMFETTINQMAEELSVDWYDYSSDTRFVADYTLFMDSDHMNSEGAKKFTNIMFEEIVNENF